MPRKRIFGKLTSNFGWWVNRKDHDGRDLSKGGFLGLDNIGVFDRSAPSPTGGYLQQADNTAWAALYSQNMLELAVELAAHEPAYEELATNVDMQFLLIARAMNAIGPDGMWDEEDGFYYDGENPLLPWRAGNSELISSITNARVPDSRSRRKVASRRCVAIPGRRRACSRCRCGAPLPSSNAR